MASQRHKRMVHGYDALGDTPYVTGDMRIPKGTFTDDLADQTVRFDTYFPTGTSFVLATEPTAMNLADDDTGLLDGTPTTVESADTTLTVTYTSPSGARTRVVDWSFAVVAA